ncbi:MAG: thrombospondin type 3 repeat-containing protein [Archangium sp.]
MKRTLLFAGLFALPAFASDPYPIAISTKYGIDPPPQSCSLCHTGGITGTGTVNTPFGTALRMRGLVAGNVTSLNTALDTLETDGADSDGDGVTDIDELKNGTDPNRRDATPTDGGMTGTGGGGGTSVEVPPLQLGVGCTSAPAGFVLGALAMLLTRRRR